ncbi:hypothetical protein C8Q78DRAFT_993232 [Trametes maxima]|nr:hypothetical protein C8Q78DRAFT_993232 [Trametes maxima]
MYPASSLSLTAQPDYVLSHNSEDGYEFLDDTAEDESSDETDLSEELVPRKRLEKYARNLRSHAPILNLLKKVLTNSQYKWPPVEKTADKLPEGGHKPKADPEAASTNLWKGGSMHGGTLGAGSSLKRGSEHIEVPASQEAPKRAKLTKHDFGDETRAHS